jgi:ectoine hydroxylase-related dioxygenase (phytanoyl-CoA dioxygenase family)
LLRIAKVKSFLTDEELARREPVTGNNDWPKYAEDFVTPAVEERIRASGAVSRQFLGKRGDVLIWHGRLMHRGMRPRIPDKERRSLITHYSGESHRPDMPDRRTDPATGGLYAYFDHPLH